MPTDSNKLLAEWQGPYPITQRMGPVDYCVDMYDYRKRKRVFHINMLKKWYPAQQPEGVNLAEQVDEHVLAEDVPTWQPATTAKVGTPTFGKHLTTEELNNLNDLLEVEAFEDVLSIKPGKTDMIEHHIVTSTTKPIKLPPYRVPQAYHQGCSQNYIKGGSKFSRS